MEVVLLFTPNRMISFCSDLPEEIFPCRPALCPKEDNGINASCKDCNLPLGIPRHVLQAIQQNFGARLWKFFAVPIDIPL